jgi:membrane protein implicated in regulation of membrane protease activity
VSRPAQDVSRPAAGVVVERSPLRACADTVFGAHGQLAVGILSTAVAIAAWVYWGAVTFPTVSAIFHVSMYFGVVACYGIIATALGYRATERVEAQQVETIEKAEEVKAEVVKQVDQ